MTADRHNRVHPPFWTGDRIEALRNYVLDASRPTAQQVADRMTKRYHVIVTRNMVISRCRHEGIILGGSRNSGPVVIPIRRERRKTAYQKPAFVPDVDDGTGVSLSDAKAGNCRFILESRDRHGVPNCCGKLTFSSSPYCDIHYDAVYRRRREATEYGEVHSRPTPTPNIRQIS